MGTHITAHIEHIDPITFFFKFHCHDKFPPYFDIIQGRLKIGHFLRHLSLRPPVEELDAAKRTDHHADAVEPSTRVATCNADEEGADIAAECGARAQSHQGPAEQAP